MASGTGPGKNKHAILQFAILWTASDGDLQYMSSLSGALQDKQDARKIANCQRAYRINRMHDLFHLEVGKRES